MTKEYTYYAFISYKSESADWALWLRKKLQSYRLPVKTHRHHVDRPYRCSPVFLDKTNLMPGHLNEGLRDEVQSAEYLIVICSRSAHDTPKYLDAELQYFLDGGGDPARVIPFVVEEGDRPEECYPSSLAALANARELAPITAWQDKHEALLSLIARMHQIDRDELRRDEIHRRRLYGGLLALLALVLLCGCFRLWDYNRPKTSLYLDYTEVYGAPVGIMELSKKDIASMSRHYRIVRSRGKVRELAYENAEGTLLAHTGFENRNRPSRITYEYRKDGMLSRAICYNQANEISLVLVYTEISAKMAVVDLQQGSEYGRSTAVDASLLSGGNYFENRSEETVGNRTARYWLVFDDNGYSITQFNIKDAATNAVAVDEDGISAFFYRRDELGRVSLTTFYQYIGLSGIFRYEEFVSDYSIRDGLQSVSYRYSEVGDLVEICFWGKNNLPVVGYQGISSSRAEYDTDHCLIGEHYFGPDGTPTLCEEGYASTEYEYDGCGHITRLCCYGTDGKPILNAYGFSGMECEYDAHGRLKAEKALDTDGEPIMLEAGYSILQFDYDENGKIVRCSACDAEGRAVNAKEGYASVAYSYGPKGEVTWEKYYGENQEPVCDANGVAAYLSVYNEQGLLTEESYFDTEGIPALLLGHYASVRLRYDDRGNMAEEAFFGTDGEPVLLPTYGYAGIRWEYDRENRRTLELYIGTDGEPVVSPYYGNAGVLWIYDEQKLRRQEICLGPDGEAMSTVGGYAALEWEYDENNKIVCERCLDENGVPILSSMNYAMLWYREDERGFNVPVYGDTDGNVISCGDCAGYEVSVDSYGNIVRWLWLGEGGEAAELNGSAGYIAEYRSDQYTPFHVQAFGAQSVPALSQPHERRTYDRRGNLLRVRYFGADDESVLTQDICGRYSSVSYDYNTQNWLTDMRFFDTEGALVSCSKGYAHLHLEWSGDGNLLSRSYFDSHDESVCVAADGYASYTNEYNEEGRLVRSSYFGADGKPMLYDDGTGRYASLGIEYNEQGEMIKTSYFGIGGEPILYADSYAAMESITEYHDQGFTVSARYLGINGEPVLSPDGLSYVVNQYDERGNWVEFRCFDTEGNPSSGRYGPGMGMRYNNNGLMIDTWPLEAW